jgi:SOS-response transcriptional repressor LexA
VEEGIVVRHDHQRNSHGKTDALTRRERDVVLAILDYQLEHDGRSPSIRELRDALGLASTNTISEHLCNLEKKGYITCEPFTARSVRLV